MDQFPCTTLILIRDMLEQHDHHLESFLLNKPILHILAELASLRNFQYLRQHTDCLIVELRYLCLSNLYTAHIRISEVPNAETGIFCLIKIRFLKTMTTYRPGVLLQFGCKLIQLIELDSLLHLSLTLILVRLL